MAQIVTTEKDGVIEQEHTIESCRQCTYFGDEKGGVTVKALVHLEFSFTDPITGQRRVTVIKRPESPFGDKPMALCCPYHHKKECPWFLVPSRNVTSQNNGAEVPMQQPQRKRLSRISQVLQWFSRKPA